MKKIGLFFVLALTLVYAQGFRIEGVKTLLDSAHKEVKEVNATVLKKMLLGDDDFVLVDLRGEGQISRGEIFHIDGMRIARGYLEFQIENKVPDKNATIVLYCCSGQRSLLAAQSLQKMGYKNVRSLQGGIKGWVESGMPLDTAFGEMILKH